MTVHRAETAENTVSFGQVLAGSARFGELFDEGMKLVEESATYLDGIGRRDSRGLAASLQQAYAAESMRLTTRLMQVASWLLIRRAIGNGELTPLQASAERVKVRLSAQTMASAQSVFAQLPETLQDLTTRSLRLQTRVLHLDRMVNGSGEDDSGLSRRGFDLQLDRLRSIYRSVA